MKTVMVLLLSVVMAQSSEKSVMRTLGDFKPAIGGDKMTFGLYEVPGEPKVIMLSVTDEHRINTVTLMGTAAEMKELLAKLKKTIEEAEKK